MSIRKTTPAEATILRSLFVSLHNSGIRKEDPRAYEPKFVLLAFEHFKRIIKKQTQDNFYGFDRLELLSFLLMQLGRDQLTEIFGNDWSTTDVVNFEEHKRLLLDETCRLFDTAERVIETYHELSRLMPKTDADFTTPLFRLAGSCAEDLLCLTKSHTNKLSDMERYALRPEIAKQKEHSKLMAASVFETHGKFIEWLVDNLPQADVPVDLSQGKHMWTFWSTF